MAKEAFSPTQTKFPLETFMTEKRTGGFMYLEDCLAVGNRGGGFRATNGGTIIANGAVAAGNGGDGFRATGGGRIIAPGSKSLSNAGNGYSVDSSGEIDLSEKSLLEKIGLPPETPVADLIELLNALNSAAPEDRAQVAKSSTLKAKLGEKLTDAAVNSLCDLFVSTGGRFLLQTLGVPLP
jgi:hypothetical protein